MRNYSTVRLIGFGVVLVLLAVTTVAVVEVVGVGQVTMQCVNLGKRETCNPPVNVINISVQQKPSIGFLKTPVRLISPINPQSITYVKPLNNITLQLYREKQQISIERKPLEFRASPNIYSQSPTVVTQVVKGAGRALDVFGVTKFANAAKAGRVVEAIKSAPDAIIGILSIRQDFQPYTNTTEKKR